MIQFKSVTKQFGTVKVLNDYTIDFEEGKTHVLLGPSGCGKSTMLRLIAGLIPPSHGEIWIQGQQLLPQTQKSLARLMGYVIQEGGLFPHLTAEKNVTLLSETLKWEQSKVKKRVQELSQLVGFSNGILEKYPKQLSGGQRQRVGLMRALMLDPPILLLDEPLGALDPITRYGLQRDLKEIFQRLKKTVVTVTHDIAEAAYFADQILFLRQGRVVQTGTFRDLVHDPADPFVTEFINTQRPPKELEDLR